MYVYTHVCASKHISISLIKCKCMLSKFKTATTFDIGVTFQHPLQEMLATYCWWSHAHESWVQTSVWASESRLACSSTSSNNDWIWCCNIQIKLINIYISKYIYIRRIYIGIYVHKLCAICTLKNYMHVWTYVCIICLNKTHCSQQLVVKFDHRCKAIHQEPIGFQTGIGHRVGEHQSFMWKVEEKVVANRLLIGSHMILCRVGFGWCHTTICANVPESVET